ncbi:RAMP superfamily CRISPR-associated protein [Solwaraspora sp. WMMD937]|uniref:RAMP superfamily CRISPR-associated protein n=1 Tax=Solwaraspora sp. WMMD937 TaxID=3016090 RepID=UPI00249A9905|nr:RAMP superfamily CRISPR-associated protein [Solwaraspora sp. WMMD937]WFE21040.1 RAMP superfamily CRISPR-associated protein [Solwaraspora sp. WMMD937]
MGDLESTRDARSGLRNGQPFTVEVEFLSDWACGTGTSRHGAVDREVQRDADGLPMLRGKALAAVLRDAAETVAVGLDDGAISGVWQDWVEAIFGSQPGASSRQRLDPGGRFRPQQRATPVPAALQARPLRLPEEVRRAIAAFDTRDRDLAREATALLRPGVAIDIDRRTAADDTFRIEERAAVGLTVTAEWQLIFPGVGSEVPWEAELLLRAAARLVDAIGGKRRRGAGRCRVTIVDDAPPNHGADGEEVGPEVGRGADSQLTALLDRVDEVRPPADVVSTGTDDKATPLGAWATEPPVHLHDLRITTLTPLLVARGVIGNMVLTERFVPGTSLLPMVAQALDQSANDRSATELITGGQVVVTNATVEVNDKRSLPVPRALHRPKDTDPDTEGTGPDEQHGDQPVQLINLLRPRTDDGRRLQPMTGYYVPDGRGGIRHAEADLVAQAHAVVDDTSQRPTEDSGGLFVYEAIAAGTVLRCELWLPAGTKLDTKWLNGKHAIGRSRKDDYGHVTVEVIAPGRPLKAHSSPDRTGDNIDGDVNDDGGDANNGQLVLWLLSDLLLSGPAGEPVTDPTVVGAVLGKRLGVTLTLPDPGPDGPPRELVTTRRVESWQRRWSMPRPSLTGLAAGSVIRFEMTGKLDRKRVLRVEATGLGERTAEGYGRIALQPPLLAADTVRLSDPALPHDCGNAQKPGTEQQEGERPAEQQPGLAVELRRRGWRRELHRTAAVRAASAELRRKFVPPDATAAQLGTLRTLADRLTVAGGPQQMLSWIAATERNRTRKEVWGAERLGLLRMLASGDDVLWRHLTEPPADIAGELHPAAAGWLLAEVVRAEVGQRRNQPASDETAAATQTGVRS